MRTHPLEFRSREQPEVTYANAPCAIRRADLCSDLLDYVCVVDSAGNNCINRQTIE